jgi:hypothetical protein
MWKVLEFDNEVYYPFLTLKVGIWAVFNSCFKNVPTIGGGGGGDILIWGGNQTTQKKATYLPHN